MRCVRSSAVMRCAVRVMASTGLRARPARNHPPNTLTVTARGEPMNKTNTRRDNISSTGDRDVPTRNTLTRASPCRMGYDNSRMGISS